MQYQLVLQFPLTEEFDFDALVETETMITVELGREHDVDGHDIGPGEINIFIHTNDPEEAFKIVAPLLNEKLSSVLRAAYRSFESNQYTWLYPLESTEEFRVA